MASMIQPGTKMKAHLSRHFAHRAPLTITPRVRLARMARPTAQRRGRTTCRAVVSEVAVKTEKLFYDLQQGSDVRGIAMEGIPDEPVTLTPIRLYFIAAGFAQWLSERTGKPLSALRISVGRDPRLSGALVKASVALGLTAQGAAVTDFGLASTPAMFMSCHMEDYAFDGAIMLTASHLPFNRNGMKFFEKVGGLDKPDIKRILQFSIAACQAAEIDLENDLAASAFLLEQGMAAEPTRLESLDFMPVYAAHLRSVIRSSIGSEAERPLEGFKIAVDAGNGAGGFVATDVLAPLGADVSGSQFLDPDGRFPNHIPNPEDADAAAAATTAVLQSGSDLGIIYDTDVDRSGVVDAAGVSINSNRMIALMSAIVLREHPGTTVVTDSVTSNGLKQFIEAQGGRHFRYRRGYKNVIGKGVELNDGGVDCELMMETSGHGALKENFFLDDGAYMSLKIVVEMVRRRQEGRGSVADLIADLKEPLEAQEFRIRIQDAGFKEIAQDATQRFHDFVESGAVPSWSLEEENYEGWRVRVEEGDGQQGWCLLRPSIHDPLCVLNIESEISGGLRQTAAHLMAFFDGYCSDLPLDLSSLIAVVG